MGLMISLFSSGEDEVGDVEGSDVSGLLIYRVGGLCICRKGSGSL